MSIDTDWDTTASSLLGRPAVPAALATGALLAEAKTRWEGRVVPRTSMHDLLFTKPGYPHPFEESVAVSWANDVFTFTLAESGAVRTGDHCRQENASAVLDAFLVQLVGGEPTTTVTVTNDDDRVVLAARAAWERGCPVASDPDAIATAALRRIASVGRRRPGTPSRDERVEDLAEGLRDHFEEDPKMAGPLMEDYRHLAAAIVDALA